MPHSRRLSASTCLFFALVALVTQGCVVGGPQVGPGTAVGQRQSTVSSKTYNGQTAAEGYHFNVEETREHGDFGWGIELGARAGITSVKVAEAPSSAIGLADEAHTDFMLSWRRFGFGVEGTLGAEGAVVNDIHYSIGGWGASAFGQFSILRPLFVTAGFGKQFGTVSRQTEANGEVATDISAAANIWRMYGQLSWIFSDSATTQWGLNLELRHTFSGDALAGARDLSWQSTGLLGEVMFIKF